MTRIGLRMTGYTGAHFRCHNATCTRKHAFQLMQPRGDVTMVAAELELGHQVARPRHHLFTTQGFTACNLNIARPGGAWLIA